MRAAMEGPNIQVFAERNAIAETQFPIEFWIRKYEGFCQLRVLRDTYSDEDIGGVHASP
jgi:hypothetical protein